MSNEKVRKSAETIMNRFSEVFRKLAEEDDRVVYVDNSPNISGKIPVKIKRLHKDAVIPKYATSGAAGFDLVAIEDVIISPGETKLVRTGLAFQIPKGYEMQIRPRSGISLKTKLRVQLGTIDADYRGDVGIIVENTCGNEDFHDYTYGLVNGNFLVEQNDEKFEVDGKYYDCHYDVYYFIRKGDRIAQGILAPAPQAQFEILDELDDTDRGTGGFGHTGVKEDK